MSGCEAAIVVKTGCAEIAGEMLVWQVNAGCWDMCLLEGKTVSCRDGWLLGCDVLLVVR